MMKIYQKAILPQGFQASALCCGIKKSGNPDLALFYSQVPAKAACLFTANKIKAAPLQVCIEHLAKGKFYQAVIANSGNANCFTGRKGLIAAIAIAKSLAGVLGLKKENILPASTGIIARALPADKIIDAIPRLVCGLSAKGIGQAKKAIMTTDTFAKEITAKFDISGKKVTICGVAKGAGMISPNMATMLVFIFSDAVITQQALSQALKNAAEQSFNCITVDGCMSTNDSVMLLSNAQAGNALIAGGKNLALFSQGLNSVCLGLAKLMVKDAEGATKFIRIKVSKAKSAADAKKAALQIANSNLFKTAMFASSANALGRVVAAVGASGAEAAEDKLKIKFSDLKKRDIEVNVSLGKGSAEAVIYTSDLSYGYVKINAEYN
ncbi:MAG: bifunctional glutamate N-acetyltransferase/amino-acid acetyltransferase ArgJ [Candidatus Omnitrophota bacterium]